jgi:DNA modification methylase
MILIGDVRQKLKELPDKSVHCCVTSPPYWGLRDYGTASWDGGDPECDHLGKPMATKANINRNCGTGNDVKNATAREFYKDICGKCGAQRIDSQIGMEETPGQFVANMVEVFREVWRVLRDDGTLWLNLGDSYVGGKGQSGSMGGDYQASRNNAGASLNMAHQTLGGQKQTKPTDDRAMMKASGLKPKDLVGIPWRVAFALQADGWYLRQDIIWHKPNPMPESVTDRCTKSHEYIFLLSKSRQYYFDNEAIKERGAMSAGDSAGSRQQDTRQTHGTGGGNDGLNRAKIKLAQELFEKGYNTRNKRDVWSVPVKPFKGAHFATFPTTLIEPCILAGCPPDGTVLDPFFGAGTTGLVAQQHGRNWIGCELNPVYAEMAAKRIKDAEPQPKLFT